MPFFVGAPDRVETAARGVRQRRLPRRDQRERRDWGELHALGALRESNIPVLAIAGECDRPQPPANARRIAEAAPHGELVVLDGVGHFPFAEDPEAYWGTLRDWLAR